MRIPPRASHALLVLLLLIGATWVAPANAQDDELDTDLLFRVTLEPDILPAAPAFVRLVRISLEPGASSPAHTHPGPEFGRVESGTLTVQVDGPAQVRRLGGSSEDPFEPAVEGSPFQLERGEQIVYLPGTPMTFRNDTEEPVRVLAAVVLPAAAEAGPRIDYVDGDPDEAAIKGLTSQVLGDGLARVLPEDGAEIVVERVRLTPEQDLPGERNPSLLSVEEGDFAFDLTEGAAQVSRGAQPGPQADMTVGDDTTLAARDAVFFPAGFGTADRNGQDGGLTYLRLVISPADADDRLPDDERGTITFNRVQPTPTETPAPGDEDGGDTVYVNSNDVNLRAEPSTGAAIVATYQPGQAMRLTGDAVDAEGIRWLPVTSVDDGNIGFISAEFLSRQPDGSQPL